MTPLRFFVLAAVLGLLLVVARSPRDLRPALRYLATVVLVAASAAVVSPFLWLVAAAFKDRSVLNEHVFFPPLAEWSSATLNFDNFRRLFAGDASVQGKVYFWQYVVNSLCVASVSTVVQVALCSAAGYALAKYSFAGKRLLLTFMLASMMIPSVLLFAPVYDLVVRLGFVDSYAALVLPGAVTPYGIFLFRQAILSVPNEMLDAGRIDGASELEIYLRLVMPLVRPLCAAFCLVCFLGSWNAFFGPSVFMHTQQKLTLPVVLNMYLGIYSSDNGVYLAGTLLAIVPPALLFFALEKEFVSGLATGAVKG